MEIIQFLKQQRRMNSFILSPNYKFRLEVFAIPYYYEYDKDKAFLKDYKDQQVSLFTWPSTCDVRYMDVRRPKTRIWNPLRVFIHNKDEEFFKTYGKEALEYAFHEIRFWLKLDANRVDARNILAQDIYDSGPHTFRIDELRHWIHQAGTAKPIFNYGLHKIEEIRERVFEALCASRPDDTYQDSHYVEGVINRKIAIANITKTPIKMEPEPPKEELSETAKLVDEIFGEEEFSSDEEEIIVIKSLDEADKEVARREEKKAHKINQLPEIVAFHKATGFIKEEEEPKREPFIYTDKTGKDWSSADPYPPGYDGPEKYMGLTGRSGKVPIQTKPKVPIQKKEVVKLPEKPNNFFAKKRLRRMSESYSERRSNND